MEWERKELRVKACNGSIGKNREEKFKKNCKYRKMWKHWYPFINKIIIIVISYISKMILECSKCFVSFRSLGLK